MARLTTMPSRSVTLVLIMLILSVYILQQNSDILDKLLVHRIGKANNFSNPPNLRHILNKDISRKSFLKRTQDLRRRIDGVAAMHGRAIRKPLNRNIQQISQSRSIVYNRINKAGSTTLISMLIIVQLSYKILTFVFLKKLWTKWHSKIHST